jgi:8-oxo-dGTP pyrophosphatase MutT (NUDIX family)
MAGVKEIRQLSSRVAYRSPWMSIREDEVEFPSGAFGTFSVVVKPDFVVVLPYANGGFWLVQQFRYPVGSRQWEFPLGAWPPGESGTPEALAAAELAEETGLRADTFTHLGRLFTAPGVHSNSFDVYLATGLVEGPPQREDTESDMVHGWRSDADIRAMMRAGDFVDSHSVAALALYDLHNQETTTTR